MKLRKFQNDNQE